ASSYSFYRNGAIRGRRSARGRRERCCQGRSDTMWYAGIDAGGTSTKVWIVREDGVLVGRGAAGPGNLQAVGADGVVAAAREALGAAARDAGLDGPPPIELLVAGVAGAGRDE